MATVRALAMVNRYFPKVCQLCRSEIPIGAKHYLVEFVRFELVNVTIGGQVFQMKQAQPLGSATLACASCKEGLSNE